MARAVASRRDAAPAICAQTSLNSVVSNSTMRSSALRIRLSYSFRSGVMKRSAFDERLLADVLRRHLRQVRRRHFDVIAEHFVVADLERFDAGALALFPFEVRDPVLRVLRRARNPVEFGRITGRDHAAVVKIRGRIGNDGARDERDKVRASIEIADWRLRLKFDVNAGYRRSVPTLRLPISNVPESSAQPLATHESRPHRAAWRCLARRGLSSVRDR